MTEAEARANLAAAIIAFKLHIKYAEAPPGSSEYMAYVRATYDLWHAQRELVRVRKADKIRKRQTFVSKWRSAPLNEWRKIAAKGFGLFK